LFSGNDNFLLLSALEGTYTRTISTSIFQCQTFHCCKLLLLLLDNAVISLILKYLTVRGAV